MEFEEEIQEEIPSIDAIEKESEELGGLTWSNWWEWLLYFRWIINAIFIGLPFVAYEVFSITWNLVLNIWFNRWWAGGNLYLIVNTVYFLEQALNALWLVFEVPIYLEWF